MKIIEHILSDFHYTSGLSVQFLDDGFNFIGSLGSVCFYPTARLKLDLVQIKKTTLLSDEHNLSYLATPFNAHPHPTGFFVAGPFYTNLCLLKNVMYKPVHIVPYFEELMASIMSKQLAVKPGYDAHVSNAINYIENNYQEPITLERICNYLNLNKNYFCSLFKSNTHQTFNQYLNRVRIEKSKKLLKGTQDSIIDISMMVGFNNHTHFSLTFKKLTGVSPTIFRNQPCPWLEEFKKRKTKASERL